MKDTLTLIKQMYYSSSKQSRFPSLRILPRLKIRMVIYDNGVSWVRKYNPKYMYNNRTSRYMKKRLIELHGEGTHP